MSNDPKWESQKLSHPDTTRVLMYKLFKCPSRSMTPTGLRCETLGDVPCIQLLDGTVSVVPFTVSSFYVFCSGSGGPRLSVLSDYPFLLYSIQVKLDVIYRLLDHKSWGLWDYQVEVSLHFIMSDRNTEC